MKKTVHFLFASFLVISLVSPSLAWAASSSLSSPTNEGNYILEYRYEFINSTKEPISKVLVKGLSLLQDNSSYYSLLNQAIDGTLQNEGNMYFFTKEIEGVKPKSTVELVQQYRLQLTPLHSPVDVSQVQPLQEREKFQTYLTKEPYIDPNNALIRQTAQELAGNESNPYIKAQVLFQFVASHMKYNLDSPIKNTGSVPAIEDVQKVKINEQQGGVCFEYATLYAALLRSQGIPARVISGFKITPYDLGDLERYQKIDIIYNLHAWVEFYLEPYGWVFADPTKDSPVQQEDVMQNFIQSNNLYIKKGYNLPFDILEYSMTSSNKTDVKVRQSAFLKKNEEVVSNPTEGNGSSNPSSQEESKGGEEVSYQPINLSDAMAYRKENVEKMLKYQQAKEEWKLEQQNKTSEKEGPAEINDTKKTNKETNSSEKTPTQEKKLNFFQKIIQFLINLFKKIF